MLFNQRINLVEPTKLLQRVTVDTLTFKRPLYHDYAANAVPISKVEIIEHPYNDGDKVDSATFPLPDLYKTISNRNALIIYAYTWDDKDENHDYAPIKRETTVKVAVNGEQIYSNTYSVNTPNGQILTTLKVPYGEVIITYTAKVTYRGNVVPFRLDPIDAVITTSAVENISPKPDRNLADVVDRVLNAGLGDNNRKYHLDDKSREKLEKYIAPEFYFTRNTLYEVLLQIGGYSDVQGIPRLTADEKGRLNTITYDFLSEEEWLPTDKDGDEIMPIGRRIEYSSDDWCGGFETYAENLVDQSENGVVIQPCMKTLRTESGNLVIEDRTVVLRTESPIYKVQSVKMGYIDSNGDFVGEIEPYVFEQSEYNNLSSYEGEYPFAKNCAMYYTQGQNDIKGLTIKKETAEVVGESLEKMSAVAIAQRVSGRTASIAREYGLAAFAYKVTYVPFVTARLKQFKPYTDAPQKDDNIVFYNQSGNSFDTNNYGSNVKNTLVQTGNKMELLTFRLKSFANKPIIGQKYKGKYISAVDYEYERFWIKATMTLIENYNRKSQYLALDSTQRFYEVSEKNSVDRICNFSSIFDVGDSEKFVERENNVALRAGWTNARNLFDFFRRSNKAGEKNQYRLIGAAACPLNENGDSIKTATLHELNVGAFGNSIFATWKYADNYSAGDQSIYNSTSKRLQKAVAYGDEYGEFHSLDIVLFDEDYNMHTSYQDQIPSEVGGTGFCDRLPALSSDRVPSGAISYNREIQKDSGEHICVTTQFHFKANTKEVIIGSALARCNFLVAGIVPDLRCVALPYSLALWQEKIPVSDVERYVCSSSVSAPATSSYISIQPNTGDRTGKSWALVTTTGEILVGRNGDYNNEFAKSIDIRFWY